MLNICSKPGNLKEPCEISNISLNNKCGLSTYQVKHNTVTQFDSVL